MKTQHTKTTITGTLTNDCWSKKSSGNGDVKYIHSEEDKLIYDITCVLDEFKDKKVRITIETID